jgi:hypothetical protein
MLIAGRRFRHDEASQRPVGAAIDREESLAPS